MEHTSYARTLAMVDAGIELLREQESELDAQRLAVASKISSVETELRKHYMLRSALAAMVSVPAGGAS